MARSVWLIFFFLTAIGASGQSVELLGLQETYRGSIGETIRVPVRLKNNSDKAVTLMLRRVANQLGTTQKNFYCIDNNCLDAKTDDILVRLEPNQVITNLQVALEAGLANGISSVRYLAFNRSNPNESFEFELHFLVEERQDKEDIYISPFVVLHDVYPNPVTDDAFVRYSVLNDQVKAKIMIHNILGNAIEEFGLPSTENIVKMRTESLNAGIYFYTLYIDNEGVVTRKLIVKK